ncbi:Serine/threonine-protein kinase PknD [Pontiella desulfatans]|uniref:Serine/threonine-protein kinase PknD n=1 Tax=Pontiella desulfatans TaxID=2750659 RepID=A0A6C2TYA1_PONDE|nr:serine/threonine-protein kinase [Pontiella desulfatans]VGO12593.1 Serine/threonine-protein kinase PknD [Pontiella desulfatans]
MNEGRQKIPVPEDELKALYAADAGDITEEERRALTPILNSLEETAERYRILEPIAEGGEKTITRIYDSCLGRSVAMARPVRRDTEQEKEDFLREARLTAGLDHPNIVPIHNIGIDADGIPFFTMELLPGDSLKDILDRLRAGDAQYRKNYPLDILLGIFQKICDAIAYAHSRQVLHLDMKPENIRVGTFGEVFVCDWGLAKVMDGTAGTTDIDTLDGDLLNDMALSGTIQGTPGFMAPEQGRTGSCSETADIYALGSLLYMLLTHELPVEGSSTNEILDNALAGKIIPPRNRKPGLNRPQSLAAVAMQALALDPAKRYASVTQLQAEIQRYLSGFTTRAEKAGPATRTVFLIRRHSRSAFLLMVFMAALIAVVMGGLLRIRTERDVAKENLILFLAEQERSEQLDSELGDVVQRAGTSVDLIQARTMLSVFDKGLRGELKPEERNQLLGNKATLLFTLQKFQAAYVCFEQLEKPGRMLALKELSHTYAQLKPNDSNLLPEKQLAELLIKIRQDYIRYLPDQTPLLQYIFFHHMQRRPDIAPEEYLPLASVMLYQLNDIMHAYILPLKLRKRPGESGYRLDLSGMHFTRYRLDIMGGGKMNILAPFGTLEMLDISDTPLVRMTELATVDAKRLRMTGLDLAHPNVVPLRLNYMRSLKELTIDLHLYDKKTQNELRSRYIVSAP